MSISMTNRISNMKTKSREYSEQSSQEPQKKSQEESAGAWQGPVSWTRWCIYWVNAGVRWLQSLHFLKDGRLGNCRSTSIS